MVLSGDDGGRDWGPGRLQVEDTFQALLRLLALLAGHLTEYPTRLSSVWPPCSESSAGDLILTLSRLAACCVASSDPPSSSSLRSHPAYHG